MDRLFGSDINGANMDDFLGITVMTNAESFTFGIISPTIWKITVTARTPSTGFWRAFIPQTILDVIGASPFDIRLFVDGVSVGLSPNLVSGIVKIDGVDLPGYMLDLGSLSFSTKTVRTDMSKKSTAPPPDWGIRILDAVTLKPISAQVDVLQGGTKAFSGTTDASCGCIAYPASGFKAPFTVLASAEGYAPLKWDAPGAAANSYTLYLTPGKGDFTDSKNAHVTVNVFQDGKRADSAQIEITHPNGLKPQHNGGLVVFALPPHGNFEDRESWKVSLKVIVGSKTITLNIFIGSSGAKVAFYFNA